MRWCSDFWAAAGTWGLDGFFSWATGLSLKACSTAASANGSAWPDRSALTHSCHYLGGELSCAKLTANLALLFPEWRLLSAWLSLPPLLRASLFERFRFAPPSVHPGAALLRCRFWQLRAPLHGLLLQRNVEKTSRCCGAPFSFIPSRASAHVSRCI